MKNIKVSIKQSVNNLRASTSNQIIESNRFEPKEKCVIFSHLNNCIYKIKN